VFHHQAGVTVLLGIAIPEPRSVRPSMTEVTSAIGITAGITSNTSAVYNNLAGDETTMPGKSNSDTLYQ